MGNKNNNMNNTLFMVLFLTVINLSWLMSVPVPSVVTTTEGSWNSTKPKIDVPCPLCWSAMSSLLNFCRDTSGKSFLHMQDFVNQCALIGEEEQQALDKSFGCGPEDLKLRSRARVWNRKLRCLSIYTGLLELYSPFDPCTQVRNIVDQFPLAACQSRFIKCVPPPVEGEQHLIPPWAKNATLPNEAPPLSCPFYVSGIIQECKNIKANNFYDRSSLDTYCNRTFSGTYQAMGCDVIREKMKANDYMMDLCSSLYAQPINVEATIYCSQTLQYSSNSTQPIPLPAYDTYLEKVKLFKEAWELADTDKITLNGPKYPADEITPSNPANTTASSSQ